MTRMWVIIDNKVDDHFITRWRWSGAVPLSERAGGAGVHLWSGGCAGEDSRRP